MKREEILSLQEMLVSRRKVVLDRVRDLQARWQALKERSIELQEEAQKASISESYDRLDEHGKGEINLIDLALTKIAIGDYGICEGCGDDIAPRRLEVIPWARLCVECARDYEKRRESLPPTFDVVASVKLPSEFNGMSNDRIASTITRRISDGKGSEFDGVKVSIRRGVLFLEGAVRSARDHESILNLIKGTLAFRSVIDHLDVLEDAAPKGEIAESGLMDDALDEEGLGFRLSDSSDEDGPEAYPRSRRSTISVNYNFDER